MIKLPIFARAIIAFTFALLALPVAAADMPLLRAAGIGAVLCGIVVTGLEPRRAGVELEQIVRAATAAAQW